MKIDVGERLFFDSQRYSTTLQSKANKLKRGVRV